MKHSKKILGTIGALIIGSTTIPIIPTTVSVIPEGKTWVASYSFNSFDTPTGDLTEGFYVQAGYKGIEKDGLFYPDPKGEEVCYLGNNPDKNKQFSTVFCSKVGTETEVFMKSEEIGYHVMSDGISESRVVTSIENYKDLGRGIKTPMKTIKEPLINL